MPSKADTKQSSKRTHDVIEIEESDGPPQKRLARSKSVKARVEHQAEVDEDEERLPDSQELITKLKDFFGRQEKPKDTFRADFSQNVSKDKAGVLEVAQRMAKFNMDGEAAFRKAFNAQVSAALALPVLKRSSHTGAKDNTSKPKHTSTQHPLWDDTQGIVRLCISLGRRFHEACEAVDQAKPTVEMGETWAADHIRLAEELQMGYRVAERQIARVVGRQEGAAMDAGAGVEAVKEDQRMEKVLAMKVPAQGVGVSGEVTLGETFRYAESGLKRFVKGLPIAAFEEDQEI